MPEREIRRAIDGGHYDRAIKLTAARFNLKVAVFDRAKRTGEVSIGALGEVTLGKAAFFFGYNAKKHKAGRASPSWLASSMLHATVRSDQRSEEHYRWGRDGTQGGLINEAEAYKAELDNASRVGLKPDEAAEIRQRYEKRLALIRPPYDGQVRAGNFSMPEVYENPVARKAAPAAAKAIANGVIHLHFLNDGLADLRGAAQTVVQALGPSGLRLLTSHDTGKLELNGNHLNVIAAADAAKALALAMRGGLGRYAALVARATPFTKEEVLGQALDFPRIAVINSRKVAQHGGTMQANLFSNVVLHEVGHLLTVEGPEYDHKLGGVMDGNIELVPAGYIPMFKAYPKEILEGAVKRYGAPRKSP
jgi:hypothetical protein